MRAHNLSGVCLVASCRVMVSKSISLERNLDVPRLSHVSCVMCHEIEKRVREMKMQVEMLQPSIGGGALRYVHSDF